MAGTRAPPVARGADRISQLPEAVIHNILSLLPAQDAVRTCVLAQGWRHRWRSAPALRIACSRGSQGDSDNDSDSDDYDDTFCSFVDGLLSVRRGGPPLDFCDFDLELIPGKNEFFDLMLHGNSWIRRVLELNVRELRFRAHCDSEFPIMEDFSPLSSQHLTSLELIGVSQDTPELLDFSGCPALERLRIEDCSVSTFMEMHSPSLKHLSIKECNFSRKFRIWMSFPSLISLELIANSGRAPMLERMAHLEAANVQFDHRCYDLCKNGRLDDCGDAACSGCSNYPHVSGCVFLRGLVQATYLNMSAYPDMYVFSRDLEWCPAFNKLKTLVLSQWFGPTDLSWFLHHTPLLEKLTLEFPEILMPTEGSDNTLQNSIAPSRLQNVFLEKEEGQETPNGSHLQNVDIKCKYVDGIVLKALKILNSNGIPQGKIRIQCSGRYNFVGTDINK